MRLLSVFISFLILTVSTQVSAVDPNFCAENFKVIASSSLNSETVIHKDRDAYTASKPFVDATRHEVQQYVEQGTLKNGAPFDQLVSCKFKSPDIVNEMMGEGTAGEPGSCAMIIESMVSKLPKAEQAGFVVKEDDTAYIGPMWIEPWPYPVAIKGDDGKIHLRGKELYAPNAWWIPMPARFKGTHYCHLPTPAYLSALAQGTAAPLEEED